MMKAKRMGSLHGQMLFIVSFSMGLLLGCVPQTQDTAEKVPACVKVGHASQSPSSDIWLHAVKDFDGGPCMRFHLTQGTQDGPVIFVSPVCYSLVSSLCVKWAESDSIWIDSGDIGERYWARTGEQEWQEFVYRGAPPVVLKTSSRDDSVMGPPLSYANTYLLKLANASASSVTFTISSPKEADLVMKSIAVERKNGDSVSAAWGLDYTVWVKDSSGRLRLWSKEGVGPWMEAPYVPQPKD